MELIRKSHSLRTSVSLFGDIPHLTWAQPGWRRGSLHAAVSRIWDGSIGLVQQTSVWAPKNKRTPGFLGGVGASCKGNHLYRTGFLWVHRVSSIFSWFSPSKGGPHVWIQLHWTDHPLNRDGNCRLRHPGALRSPRCRLEDPHRCPSPNPDTIATIALETATIVTVPGRVCHVHPLNWDP